MNQSTLELGAFRMRRFGAWALAAAAGFAVALIQTGAAQNEIQASPVLTQNTFAEIAEKTLPSVVAVYVSADIRDQMRQMHGDNFLDDPRMKEFFKDFKGEGLLPGEEESEGGGEDEHGLKMSPKDDSDDSQDEMFQTKTSGSGVILSADGYIVTNLHIVNGAKEGTISVVLNDDTEIPGEKVKLVASDDFIDLAVLKIDATGLDLKPIAWGDSDQMRIGDWVVAIGNPLDLRGSVSTGIISAKARKIYKVDIEHLIQTDTMINPGNSGGALVNLKGELIGINMAIATNSGFFQGIGFAIPSKDARFITDQVISQGKIKRGYIGIEMWPLTEDMRKAMGIEAQPKRGKGIVVSNVLAGAPADKAGVKPYDVIYEVDGTKINETRDLLGVVASKAVGETAELKVLREREGKYEELALPMQVVERPPDAELTMQRRQKVEEPEKKAEPKKDYEDLGMELKPHVGEEVRGLEVVKVEPKSPAARAGIAAGDILLEVNRRPVTSLEDYSDALSDAKDAKRHLMRFLQEGRRVFATIERAPK